MSKYDLWFDCGDDDRLPEWCVCETLVSNNKGSISKIVFHSTSKEEAETILEEYQIAEQGAEYDLYTNQESEFDYV
jgi:hypothetical protein